MALVLGISSSHSVGSKFDDDLQGASINFKLIGDAATSIQYLVENWSKDFEYQ